MSGLSRRHLSSPNLPSWAALWSRVQPPRPCLRLMSSSGRPRRWPTVFSLGNFECMLSRKPETERNMYLQSSPYSNGETYICFSSLPKLRDLRKCGLWSLFSTSSRHSGNESRGPRDSPDWESEKYGLTYASMEFFLPIILVYHNQCFLWQRFHYRVLCQIGMLCTGERQQALEKGLAIYSTWRNQTTLYNGNLVKFVKAKDTPA